MPLGVLNGLLEHGDTDDHDEGSHVGHWMHWGELEEREDRNDEEVEVGHPLELLIKTLRCRKYDAKERVLGSVPPPFFFLPMNTFQTYLWEEGHHSVLASRDAVVDILGSLVLFSLVDEDFPSLWTLDPHLIILFKKQNCNKRTTKRG